MNHDADHFEPGSVELAAPFDAARYIKSDAGQRELLADAFNSLDRRYVTHALDVIAKARGGVGKLAKETGLGRQALYRALGDDGNPTLDTLLKVAGALGAGFVVVDAKRPELAG